ncbi:MAG TPA: GNAT family N-acetyltransferase [Rhizomicrobium sp.]|nr:GNAT family N-acetyltransferase [Rhizomicrobium sp.]
MNWEIERALGPTPDVVALVSELESELSPHYPPEQRHGLSLNALFEPHIHFLVARQDGQGAGCGGVALFAGFAELKRFYVKPALRGRGIADAILRRAGDIAAAAGRTILRLETGTQQQAALRFYARSGFRRCAAFEPYASMPPEAIASSVFMEKALSWEG